jgi:uncharacterized membrane protein
MVLVLLLLWIEARRYRFFDVYRARVRQLERGYFSQVFSPAAEPDRTWLGLLAQDLRRPCFLITIWMAVSRRLRRNYIWMFLVLLVAWSLKIATPRLQEEGARLEAVGSLRDIVENAALGPVPGWFVLVAVALFYLALACLTFTRKGEAGELAYGDVHV